MKLSKSNHSFIEVVVVVDICAADYVFYSFCTYIRMQFRLLKHNIERFIPNDVIDGRVRNIEEVRAEFVVLIKWHQDLIRLVSVFNNYVNMKKKKKEALQMIIRLSNKIPVETVNARVNPPPLA